LVSEEEILSAEPYVRYAARRVYKGYRVPFEDLVSAGMVGVMKAAKSFDPSRGVKFTTYAQSKIRGSMLDEIRRMDRLSRRQREKRWKALWAIIRAEEGDKAPDELYDELWNNPEVSHIPILPDRHENAKGEIYCSNGFTRDCLLADENAVDPFRECLKGEEAERVRGLVNRLPEEYKEVIELYYFAGMTLQAIADRLGVSKTCVSKYRDIGLASLRGSLENEEV
jgi:RNA polymerase sigma factor for flagellar operon FliA